MTFIQPVLAILLAAAPSEWMERRVALTKEAERLRDVYRRYVNAADEPAEGVVLPIETHPDGSVAMSVSAKCAQIFPKEGFVLARDVLISRLDEKGSELSKIEARTCLVDRNAKSGWAEGAVKIVNGKTVFDGEDVYFSMPEGYVMSLGRSKFFSEDLGRAKGVEKDATLTVSSRRCDFDRTNGVILFDGEAEVDYSAGYVMNADRLFIHLVGTNSFDRIISAGHVTLTNGCRRGTCGRAVFLRASNEIEMTGADGVPARLSDQGAGEIAGRRIRLWIDREQVEVKEAVLTFDRGRAQGKGMEVWK